MKVVKRAGRIIFAILMVLSLSTSVLAIDQNKDNQIAKQEEITSTTVFGVVDDGIILQRQEDGSFDGTINVENTKGVVTTKIRATLTGNVASIANRYVLEFHWEGTAKVGSLAANTIEVIDTTIIFPDEYFSREGYTAACYGATNGSRTVGTFTIPEDVTEVRVRTTGLRAYFLDSEEWFATRSINTIFNVN
jgi:hypothetical protein